MAVFAEAAAAAIANARRHAISEECVVDLTELDQLKDEFLALITHELRTPLTSRDSILDTSLRRPCNGRVPSLTVRRPAGHRGSA